MDIETVFFTDILRELADSLQKWLAFDVADCPTDLGDYNIGVFIDKAFYNVFDLVSDMRDDLDGFPQKLSLTLFLDYRQIDLSGSVV